MIFLDSFNFWKKEKEDKHITKARKESVIVPEDGSININGMHSFLNFSYDSDFKNHTQQVETYRNIAEIADVDEAINEIVNESINFEDDDISPVYITLDETTFGESTKEIIIKEFENILDLLNFNLTGYEQFREWYIDGSTCYHKIIDKNNKKQGLIGIEKLDTSKTRKIRNIERDENGKIINSEEYFLFDENAGKSKKIKNDFTGDHVIKFPIEAIAYSDSGMYHRTEGYPKSHLHKAIKPVNNLIAVEVSSVIYRVGRSSEKRVFYVDVGNLQNTAAEEYIKKLMNSYRNKISYNNETGEISSHNKITNMLEDIWLPRKNGKNTEVDTLNSGQNLGEMDDVEYMLKKVYRSLNVPTNRLQSDSLINIGNLGEIDREELKFNKFIKRLRKRFNILFLDLLQTQILLKNIITHNEWKENKNKIKLIYNQDLYISEQKETNILEERLNLAEKAMPFIGKYVSHEYVRKNILKQTEENINQEDKLIKTEQTNPNYQEKEL